MTDSVDSNSIDSRGSLLAYATRNLVPLEVSLELTHHCNFRCQHCYIPDFQARDGLSTERALHLLDELAAMGTLYLTLTGGELLLRKDWYRIATRARELGFRLGLFTNGALIDDTRADRISALNCPVEITVYSMDEDIFDRITQRAGSFEKTMAGIRRLRERDIELELKIPMMTHNYRCVDDVRAFAGRIGAGFRADAKIIAKKDGDTAPLDLKVPEEELLDYYRGPNLPCSVPEEQPSDPETEGPMCGAGNRFAAINAAGEVWACTILPGSAGNLNERSFRDIWENSPWLAEIRSIRRSNVSVCSTCPKHSYCGRCHAQALVEDGNIKGPSSWACNHAATVERVHGLTGEPGPSKTIPIRVNA